MKKKILVLTLMVTLISVSVFAGRNHQNATKGENQQRIARVENQQGQQRVMGVEAKQNQQKQQYLARAENQQGNPMYVQVGENTYKNVETNKIVLKENLPANCVLLDDDFVKGIYRNDSVMNKDVQNKQRINESYKGDIDRDASNNNRGGRNSSNRNTRMNRK